MFFLTLWAFNFMWAIFLYLIWVLGSLLPSSSAILLVMGISLTFKVSQLFHPLKEISNFCLYYTFDGNSVVRDTQFSQAALILSDVVNDFF